MKNLTELNLEETQSICGGETDGMYRIPFEEILKPTGPTFPNPPEPLP